MVKEGNPRRGSLQFYPRKRAKRIYPAIKTYPKSEKARILGFAGYKAGMLHAIIIDNKKNSPTFGQEISVPITVLDCPPLKVLGIRVYESTTKGFRALSEAWTKELPKDLSRKLKINPKEYNLENIEKMIEKISKVRIIVATQPKLSGIGKKKPEVFEIEVGGTNIKEKIDFAKSLLGKEIRIEDFVKDGELVDVISITKGKGYAGPVKRFGIKIQNRKAHKKRRHVGTLGPETPSRVRWTVPMAGQMGFMRRTEINKRVLKVGKGEEITPKGGFKRYGKVKTSYLIVEGSVPGEKKRLVFIRAPIRPGKIKFLPTEIKKIVS